MLLCVCTFLSHLGCSNKKGQGKEKTILLVTNPLKIDTFLTNEYVCQIHSISHIELRALERGYLQDIFIDEGQSVKKGQLLFRIIPKIYEAEVQKAEAEVSIAEIEYSNVKSLFDKNVVSATEVAMAKARLNKAKGELNLAKTHLNFTEIRAPFDGIIDRFHARQGSLLSEGDLITTLSDNSKMWVYFNVPEAEYLDYKSTTQEEKPDVRLIMANHKIFPYPGYVETIEADFDNETGNIPFRATFMNPEKLLRHGETGNILMKKTIHNSIIIPQKATFEILDKKYVFVVGTDSVVRSREIRVGSSLEDLFIVTSGLNEKDRILFEGLRKVKENEKINYQFTSPRSVYSNLKLPTE